MVRDEDRAMNENTRLQAACGQASISVDDNAASSWVPDTVAQMPTHLCGGDFTPGGWPILIQGWGFGLTVAEIGYVERRVVWGRSQDSTRLFFNM